MFGVDIGVWAAYGVVMLSDQMLVSPAMKMVLNRGLECGGIIIPRSHAETVAVRELEARRMLRPALHLGAYAMTESGTACARTVGAP